MADGFCSSALALALAADAEAAEVGFRTFVPVGEVVTVIGEDSVPTALGAAVPIVTVPGGGVTTKYASAATTRTNQNVQLHSHDGRLWTCGRLPLCRTPEPSASPFAGVPQLPRWFDFFFPIVPT